jgi:hypothetical protein
MTIDPVALVRRYHAALENYEEKNVAPLFAPGAVYASPGVNGRIAGRAAILSAFNAYFSQYPDQHAVDESITALTPLKARASWRLEATERSTGRPIARRGIETVSFDSDGLILVVEVVDQ